MSRKKIQIVPFKKNNIKKWFSKIKLPLSTFTYILVEEEDGLYLCELHNVYGKPMYCYADEDVVDIKEFKKTEDKDKDFYDEKEFAQYSNEVSGDVIRNCAKLVVHKYEI